MSTSYERGSAASQAVAGARKVDAGPVDLGVRPERPLPPSEPSASPLNAAADVPTMGNREEERVKDEGDPLVDADAVNSSAKTANEECCFGILQCDES